MPPPIPAELHSLESGRIAANLGAVVISSLPHSRVGAVQHKLLQLMTRSISRECVPINAPFTRRRGCVKAGFLNCACSGEHFWVIYLSKRGA